MVLKLKDEIVKILKNNVKFDKISLSYSLPR
jgi:hypothetical protein